MKRLEAIIKPFKLEEVKEALAELGPWLNPLHRVHQFVSHRPLRADIKTDKRTM